MRRDFRQGTGIFPMHRHPPSGHEAGTRQDDRPARHAPHDHPGPCLSRQPGGHGAPGIARRIAPRDDKEVIKPQIVARHRLWLDFRGPRTCDRHGRSGDVDHLVKRAPGQKVCGAPGLGCGGIRHKRKALDRQNADSKRFGSDLRGLGHIGYVNGFFRQVYCQINRDAGSRTSTGFFGSCAILP